MSAKCAFWIAALLSVNCGGKLLTDEERRAPPASGGGGNEAGASSAEGGAASDGSAGESSSSGSAGEPNRGGSPGIGGEGGASPWGTKPDILPIEWAGEPPDEVVVFHRWEVLDLEYGPEYDDGIWIGRTTGDERHPLFAGSHPSLSPDGTRLAYVLDGAIWISNSDGSDRHAITARDGGASWPRWSPDGDSLVFERNNTLFRMRYDGEDVVPLLPADKLGRQPDWRGNQIAYTSNGDLWIKSADDAKAGTKVPVSNDGPSVGSPALSPDASQVTSAFGGVLYLMGLDGSNGHVLATGHYAEEVVTEPAWSNDGQSIVFTRVEEGLDLEAYSLGVMPADAMDSTSSLLLYVHAREARFGRYQPSGSTDAGGAGGESGSAGGSSEGGETGNETTRPDILPIEWTNGTPEEVIVYHHWEVPTEYWRVSTEPLDDGIWIGTTDREERHPLFSGSDPCLSPDGSRLAYVLEGAIWISNADGSDRHAITPLGAGATWPRWSPDGSSLVFARDNTLFRMQSDGEDVVRLLPADQSGWHPDWLGDQIVYDTGAGGGIWIKSANHAEAGTEVLDEGSFPTLSPDMSQIAYVSAGQAWVMKADGSDPQPVDEACEECVIEGTSWSNDGEAILFTQFWRGTASLQRVYLGSVGGSRALYRDGKEGRWGIYRP
jgi:Tol biopolymer transport system component